jgi:hypothetical protein
MRPMGIYCTNFLMGIPTIDLILMVDHREQSAFLFDILDAFDGIIDYSKLLD